MFCLESNHGRGTSDAELKVLSVENQSSVVRGSTIIAWSSLDYSFICFACCHLALVDSVCVRACVRARACVRVSWT